MNNIIKSWVPWAGYLDVPYYVPGDVVRFFNRVYLFTGNSEITQCPSGLLPIHEYRLEYLDRVITNSYHIDRLINYYNELIYQVFSTKGLSIPTDIVVEPDRDCLWSQIQ